MSSRNGVLAIAVVAICLARADAQDVPVRGLSVITAKSPPEFTGVTDVRELSDKRVIVVDFAARELRILNSSLTSATLIGRAGDGPGEYRIPAQRLIHQRGDSTAFRDGGSGLLHVILPQGAVGASFDRYGRARTGTGTAAANPLAIPLLGDAGGFVYGRGERVSARGAASETAAIEKWRLGSTYRDTVASIQLEPRQRAGAGFIAELAPFRHAPQWTVAPDGRVAVAYPDTYRIEIYDASGARRVNVTIPFTRLRVTDAHKKEWMQRAEEREQAAASGRVVTSRSGQRLASEPMPVREPESWPTTLPPFLIDAIRFDNSGRLWVERTTAAGQPQTFDVIDAGRVVDRVMLPRGSTLVGFGDGVVYATAMNDSGLGFLQRIRM